MARIISTGVERQLTNNVVGDRLSINNDEHRFVTFITENGGVHTIIVDAEHAAKDADELLKWFDKTRTLVETAPASDKPGHIVPAEILELADAALGFSKPEPAAEPAQGGAL
jgi:hypothetical protein